MAYSFIDTPAKSPFSPAVRKVWLTGVFAVGVMLAVAVGIHLYAAETEAALAKEVKVQETLALQADQLKQQRAQYEMDKVFKQQASTADQLLADQLFDLLDLVPDGATLTRFEFTENALLYAGVCDDYAALKTGMQRAFSGQYRLVESTDEAHGSKTAFQMKFVANGEVQ